LNEIQFICSYWTKFTEQVSEAQIRELMSQTDLDQIRPDRRPVFMENWQW